MAASKILGMPSTTAVSILGGLSAAATWLILHGMMWQFARLQQFDSTFGKDVSRFLFPFPYPIDLFFFLLIPALSALLISGTVLRACRVRGAFTVSLFGVAIIHVFGTLMSNLAIAASNSLAIASLNYWLKLIAVTVIASLVSFCLGYFLKHFSSTKLVASFGIITLIICVAVAFVSALSSENYLLRPTQMNF